MIGDLTQNELHSLIKQLDIQKQRIEYLYEYDIEITMELDHAFNIMIDTLRNIHNIDHVNFCLEQNIGNLKSIVKQYRKHVQKKLEETGKND